VLIDEIDIGLHHSVLHKLWRFVIDTAKEFNVQIFATTHSLDCVRSLADVCVDDPQIGGEVSIQRIETTGFQAVSYTNAEISALAKSFNADAVEVR